MDKNLLVFISFIGGFVLSTSTITYSPKPSLISAVDLHCAISGGVEKYRISIRGVGAKCADGREAPTFDKTMVGDNISSDDIDYELCHSNVVSTRWDDDDRLAEPDGWSLYETQPWDTED